ncbi:hypothetical protein Ae201684_012331 [Aphanomyces euteiches]|uniref:LNS2/PITP domain-containing protein n=1 Tax=Aphanomyces euteiches TaxID=100861 RepID=A0A6G0WSA2_9STRA|nr:hypothetical protein Ae201684_012331 [Aphanomyces euteiches]KAH9157230.1 hypothetical protein AeRB84_000905 [Aphanomyces euteiches]
MNVLNSVKDYVSNVFDSGSGPTEAIDVVAVLDDTAKLEPRTRTTPFYVRFEMSKYHGKRVEVRVNGVYIPAIVMEVADNGEAHFVHPGDEEELRTMEDLFYADTPDPPSDEPFPLPVVDENNSQQESSRTKLSAATRTPSVYFDVINPSIERTMLKKNTSDYFDAASEAPLAAPPVATAATSIPNVSHHIVLDMLPSTAAPRLSLCGHLINPSMTPEAANELFQRFLVTPEVFHANPISILQDPKVMILAHGALHRYDLFMQAFFISKVCFLPSEDVLPSASTHPQEPMHPEPTATPLPSEVNDQKSTEPSRWLRWFRSTSSSISNDDSSPRVLFPSQKQLDLMNLAFGANKLEFRIKATVFGEDDKVATSTFYLWHTTTKLVVADVEATISSDHRTSSFLRSSVKEVVIDGAVDFYGHIVHHGYEVVYLSSRRHQDIRELVSGLPRGPLLAAFGGLDNQQTPEELQQVKFSMIERIQGLYPGDVNPFYAALVNDASAKVLLDAGVAPGKVLVMDPTTSRFSLAHQKVFKQQHTTYSGLRADTRTFDAMFPPIVSVVAKANNDDSHPVHLAHTEDAFNDLNFWRVPPPTLS